MHHPLKQVNERVTRTLVDTIQRLPAPVKIAVGLLPGAGAAMSYADVHRWSILKLAEHYASRGELSPHARRALEEYQQAVQREQKALGRLQELLANELVK